MALAALAVGLALAAAPARAAADITALRTLDFGVLAVTDNGAPASARLSPNGLLGLDSGIVFVAAAAPGRYRLRGLPPFTLLQLNMPPAVLTLRGAGLGAQLAATHAAPRPQSLRTDLEGTVEFDLGATLTTDGSGMRYEDGLYVGRAMLELTFEVDGALVASYPEIDLGVELRSTLSLVQIQPLDFGKLSVLAAADGQAALRLAPNGQLALDGSGSARIVRYGGESPGIFRVSGGGAFARVRVELPATTVYLTHQSQAPAVPRLLVSDFVTQPRPDQLQLDARGDLEFRLGATLRTEQGPGIYQDGTYTGLFSMTLAYQ